MSTVLVVEDSRTQQALLSGLLKEKGLKVSLASDGMEALEKVETVRPDVVLLDVIMPRMNGYECCRRLKSNPKTNRIPVVICSSKKEEVDRYWSLKQGADAYIAKPFHPSELLSTLKRVLPK